MRVLVTDDIRDKGRPDVDEVVIFEGKDNPSIYRDCRGKPFRLESTLLLQCEKVFYNSVDGSRHTYYVTYGGKPLELTSDTLIKGWKMEFRTWDDNTFVRHGEFNKPTENIYVLDY